MLPAIRNGAWTTPMTGWPTNRLDSFFDRILGEDGPASQAQAALPLSMWEDDEHYWIEVEAPGFAESDVEVTAHNGMLLIRGDRKPAEGRKYLYNTRSFGRFERLIRLPESVSPDAVQARLANGVLVLTLPKTPEAKPRRIAVQTS